MSEENSKEIEQLKNALRQKRNTAQAGIFVAVIVAILSAAWLYVQSDANSQKSHEANEIVISADSLSQIKSKIEEQELHIQTQDEEIARMRAEKEELESEAAIKENESADDPVSEDNSQVSTDPVNLESSFDNDKIHVIERGETLWSIAVKYFNDGHRNVDLAANNAIADAAHIITGETLRLD
tara:strand:+ start:164 stop:712 length:549 start_codon:yes stop_codon:yes gene_type:complete